MSSHKSGRRASRASALRKLAEHVGILSEFTDQSGRVRRTRDDTRVALLAAMHVDASDVNAAAYALEERKALEDSRLLGPVGRAEAGTAELRLALARDAGKTIEWTMSLSMEDGTVEHASGRARRRVDGSFALPLARQLPIGYHRLRLTVRARGANREGTQLLIAAPPTCPSPEMVLQGQRVFGIIANLYSVRSADNWGAGNLGDLAALVGFAANVGAAFVGVNPLHALRNSGHDISPYSPVSRLFRNPLYLDVTAIPELAQTPSAREHISEPDFQRELARLRNAANVDYGVVVALQRPVLEELHRAFTSDSRAGAASRRSDYTRYVAQQGRALDDFATFCALEETLTRSGDAPDWRKWQAQYRDPFSADVIRFRQANADRVDFHRWVQFEVDRQLGDVAAAARSNGLPIGVYQDLAIGTAPTGSDTWAFGDLFIRGACVGAPPDPLALQGQNWGLPPIDPQRLVASEFAYWIALVRGALRHAGALRIDHILGLFRQYWIPDGTTGRNGAYVRFPSSEMLAILAIESTRTGAIVVGEDLGTVPPEVHPALERWGILSSRVLYFERTAKGGFKAAEKYPRMALTTATTHDLPTVAGFWSGRDVAIRSSLGLTRDASGRSESRTRDRDRTALLRRLCDDALLPPGADSSTDDLSIRAGVHAFLRRTPSWLVGFALDDLVGETEPVNVPGVGPDRFRSWTRRLTTPMEQLVADRTVLRALGVERRWVGPQSNTMREGESHLPSATEAKTDA